MIIVTGAAGFIGSCLVSKLNQEGFTDLILVDDFSDAEKMKNLENKKYSQKVHRDEFIQWLKENGVRHYNLGGINPETNPGVYHFKRGLSGLDSLYVEALCACTNPLSKLFARAGLKMRGGLRMHIMKWLQAVRRGCQ